MSRRSSHLPPRPENVSSAAQLARPLGSASRIPEAKRPTSLPDGSLALTEGPLQRAERLGFRAGRSVGSDRIAPARSPAGGPAADLQRKYLYKGFPLTNPKYGDVSIALEGSSNKYLDFLSRSASALVEVNLVDSPDPNPGDATLYFQATSGSDFQTDFTELRKLSKLERIKVVINVRKWYFEKYSSGKVLAMLAHEIGVHIVPYLDEVLAKLPASKFATPDAKYIDPTKQSGLRGRDDHLRVADVGHVDFELYQGVVKDMMAAVIKENKTGGQKAADELADAYLLDLSTFAKSGARIKTPFDAGEISTKYNAYRKKTGLTKSVPEKSPSQVWADYALLYAKVLPVVAKAYPKTSTAVLITLLIVIYLLYWLLAAGKAFLAG